MSSHLYSIVQQSNSNDKKITNIVGLFSNKKNLFEALNKICCLDDYYIKGERKNKKINHSTLSTSFNRGFLKIYNEFDEDIFMIWDLTVNKINPELLK
jgi:hypothetical protein